MSSELTAWYERYIEVFNVGDREAFAAHFHPPVTVLHATRYDERRAGRELPIVSEAGNLWAPLPKHWARSTIDSVTALSEVAVLRPPQRARACRRNLARGSSPPSPVGTTTTGPISRSGRCTC